MPAAVQLFILPFAGGRAAQFDDLCAALTPEIDAAAIEYAGRGTRAREPLFTGYDPFLRDLGAQLAARRDPALPYALLGYSVGAFFACDLLAGGLLSAPPCRLFLCGCENDREPRPPLSALPEEEFWERIIALGGVDSRLLAHRKFLKLFSKTLRADFALAEQHRRLPAGERLACPVTVLYAEADTPLANVRRWQEVCSRPVEYKAFAGDHFFLLAHPQKSAAALRSGLL